MNAQAGLSPTWAVAFAAFSERAGHHVPEPFALNVDPARAFTVGIPTPMPTVPAVAEPDVTIVFLADDKFLVVEIFVDHDVLFNLDILFYLEVLFDLKVLFDLDVF